MFGKREAHLVVLNDLDEARAALRKALDDADAETAPGLRRALEMADGIGAGEDPRVRWTRQVLAEARLDPKEQEIAAIRAVRGALPGLSLVAAVDLVRRCQARP
ncbi:hypothetical protein [Streptomyces sp. NPDC051636]|uniref:hypothetical protein n=1 Tax=Streptomyces sp. NPDC051636 TaxID=3365663 RepID=UPI0037B57531